MSPTNDYGGVAGAARFQPKRSVTHSFYTSKINYILQDRHSSRETGKPDAPWPRPGAPSQGERIATQAAGREVQGISRLHQGAIPPCQTA